MVLWSVFFFEEKYICVTLLGVTLVLIISMFIILSLCFKYFNLCFTLLNRPREQCVGQCQAQSTSVPTWQLVDSNLQPFRPRSASLTTEPSLLFHTTVLKNQRDLSEQSSASAAFPGIITESGSSLLTATVKAALPPALQTQEHLDR